MKCPKCDYLGFETGDRCKNCGYDFSLATNATVREPELLLREPEPPRDADRWLTQLEARLDSVRPVAAAPATDRLGAMSLSPDAPASPASAPAPPASPPPAPTTARTISESTPALPFFSPGSDFDEAIITVPPAPRPLAVRRTPERRNVRTVPKPIRKIDAQSGLDPVLEFAEEPPAVAPTRLERRAQPERRAEPLARAARSSFEVSGAFRRVIAAAVDQLILLSIDAVVVYFTFQIAGLSFAEWQLIPLLPLGLFLLLVKASYFSVFTALGGQTVGKMATGIRVVGENDRDVEPTRAVQRTLAALASVATIGIGFAPVLLGGDRRALHDRVAGTRVVGPIHE
jgi:uncharacterized RDD family membrane protein YckC